MLFSVALFSEQASMALMYYSGGQLDSVLLLVANLTFVLAVSSGVHLINYYRDAVRSGNASNAVSQAVSSAFRPLLLAAGTTALGMGSLTISRMAPIQNFGGYAAASVLFAAFVLLVLLPAEIELWPFRRPLVRAEPRLPFRHSSRPWSGITQLLLGTHGWVLLVTFPALIGSLVGVYRVNTSVQLHDMFEHDSRVIRDSDWLEEHIGYLVPIEVVLRFPAMAEELPDAEAASRLVDRLRLVKRVQQAALSLDGVGAAVSATAFAPELPADKAAGFREMIRRTVTSKRIFLQRDDFRKLGFLYEDGTEQLWRISLRVPAGGHLDYGQLLEIIQRRVRPLLQREQRDDSPVTAVFCGGVPLVHKAQEQLLLDLIDSFGMAFLLIALTMAVLLRSLPAGMLIMIPNALPSLLVFGTMGWLGINVEIGSMLTASAALGIAVDDTLHFITWYRRRLESGSSHAGAVRFALQHCGTAMIQTSLICSLGLVVFSFSEFVPIARFAWLMFTLLLLALLCDMILLPSILLSPLGRFFYKPPGNRSRTTSASPR
jgi:hypothetical protein